MSPRLNDVHTRRARIDNQWMNHALQLAERSSRANTMPNPQVACILVKNNRLVSQAVHERFGGFHAEALALEKAKTRARGATAYLTLEPCSHTDKKTSPCVDALIRAGIKRVVVACKDENPQVNGKGIRKLRRAGVQVHLGILNERARKFYRFFFHWIKTGRPFVTLKMASSLDGRITAETRYLSSPASLEFVQELRAAHDAILVGKNTIKTDDPKLTIRKKGFDKNEQPLRVILDSRLELSPNCRVFYNGPSMMACTNAAPDFRRRLFQRAGILLWVSPKSNNGSVPLGDLLDELGRRGVRSILVEGGSRIVTSFFEQNLVNEAFFFVTPWLSGLKAVPLYQGRPKKLNCEKVSAIGTDAVFQIRFAPITKRL